LFKEIVYVSTRWPYLSVSFFNSLQ